MHGITKALVVYTLLSALSTLLPYMAFLSRPFPFTGIDIDDILQFLMPFAMALSFFAICKEVESEGAEYMTTRGGFILFFLIAAVVYSQGSALLLVAGSGYLFTPFFGNLFLNVGVLMMAAAAMHTQMRNAMVVDLNGKEKVALHLAALVYSLLTFVMALEGDVIYAVAPAALLLFGYFLFKLFRKGRNIYEYPVLAYFLQALLLFLLIAIIYGGVNGGFPQLGEVAQRFK